MQDTYCAADCCEIIEVVEVIMRIDCVTVCVNFADILAHSLAANKSLFDNMVVVTDSKDSATQRLCEHQFVTCVVTDDFYKDDHAFNKGRGINKGLEKLNPTDWVLHMDADIVLPSRSRQMLTSVCDLNDDCIYGIDRLMCPDFTTWSRHQANPTLTHAAEMFVVPDAFPVGTRVAKLDGSGYLPIGFFQLWNAGKTGIREYPDRHGTAGRADMLHALRWPRQKRQLIPELFGVHLGSPIAKGRTNWRGRIADPFGPVGNHYPNSNPSGDDQPPLGRM